MFQLSTKYEAIYDQLLENVGASSHSSQMSVFWPMCGHQFDGDLFVIGKTANGCDVNGNKQDFMQARVRRQIIAKARKTFEREDVCPMLWLTDSKRYHWKGSAFFRVMQRVSLQIDTERAENWSSWICYSNLLKVGLTEKNITPPVSLRKMQLPCNIRLLQQELEEISPRRVLVLTGTEWFRPFADKLGLKIRGYTGLVEGVAMQDERQWVIAKHPMGKREDDLVDEVMKAFTGRLKR